MRFFKVNGIDAPADTIIEAISRASEQTPIKSIKDVNITEQVFRDGQWIDVKIEL